MKNASIPIPQPNRASDVASGIVIEALGLLLRAAPDQLDSAIDAVLAKVAQASGADRAHLSLLNGDVWTCSNEWCAPGVGAMIGREPTIVDASSNIVSHEADACAALSIPSVQQFPDGPLRKILQQQGIKSLLAIPFSQQMPVRGCVGLERMTREHPFDDDQQWILETLVDGMATALARRTAEQNLKALGQQQTASLERLRATLAAMPELVLEIDEDGRCIDFHCTDPTLFAHPPEEILGRSLEETLPADIAHQQRQGMAEARRCGTANVGPYALGQGSAQRWFALTIAHINGDSGTEGFVFRVRDVTVERAREKDSTLLAGLTQRMTNPAMVLDPDMRVRWANPALAKLTGYPLDDIIGRRPSDVADPASDPQEFAKIQHALTTRTPGHAEISKHDRNGDLYSVEVDVQPLFQPNGALDGFFIIETDVTKQKTYQATLEHHAQQAEAARQRLQEAISAIPDAFAMFDANDRLVLYNHQYSSAAPSASAVIKPGVSFEEILQAGILGGDFPDAIGNEDAWKEKRLSLHRHASESIDLQLSDGRWKRAYERRTPDGGRVGLRIDITELKNAEQRLNNIIEGAEIGIWEYDVASDVVEPSERWSAMLGAPSGSLLKLTEQDLRDRLHPDDVIRAQTEMRNIILGNSARFEAEVRIRHRDGHWIHVLTRGQAAGADGSGRPPKITGVGLDVTKRRHAEDRLKTILAASSIGTWQLNGETGVNLIDDQYAAMLGNTLEELNPWTHANFEARVHPDDLPGLFANISALHQAKETSITHEFRMRHNDGRWIWILSQTHVKRWSKSGVPAEESGIHIDITERKTREAALIEAKRALEKALDGQRASEQRFADIAAVSDEWFWEIDAQFRIVHLSSGFERITGLQIARMIGQTLERVGFGIGSQNADGDWHGLARLFANRDTLSDLMFRLVLHADRPPIWMRISGAPIFDDSGAFVGYRGVGSDVSALISATERAEAASLAKSRFLATMSHELRTPLTGVLGMADLLSETTVTAKQREMIETVRDSGEGLLAIVNDILDLAKIEAGKMTLDNAVFSPADVFRRVRALFTPKAHAAGLVLGLEISPNCSAHHVGDEHRLLQILNNIVGNAIKFTTAGSVTIHGQMTSADTGDILSIRVVDTGIGMTATQSAKVFEEFEQAEGSTARRFGGTGLGLSITRHLVTLMGGTIALKTEVDHGTEVTVTLPLAKQKLSEPDTEIAQNYDPAGLAGMRVLVADDNHANRRILETLLGNLAIEVTMAQNGHEALAQYEPGAFDVLLLDISMPGLDGIGALREIRALEIEAQIPAVPALAVTANAMQHQINEYLAAGFDGHIAKPFRKATLLQAIARQSHKSR